MTVTSDITKDDVVALHRFIARSPAQRRVRSQVYLAGLAIGAFPVLILGMMLLGGRAALGSYLVLLPPLVFHAGFWTWLFMFFLFPSTPRVIPPDRLGLRTTTLTEQGLRHSGPGGEVLYFWKSVGEVKEDAAYFFIAVAEAMYAIPKRAFSNEKDIGAFRAETARLRGAQAAEQ